MSNDERNDAHYQPEPNEYTTINDVTAKCKLCDWQTTGPLEVEINSEETVVTSKILSQCTDHHTQKKQHNRFDLFHTDKIAGFVVVSSAGSAGTFEIPPEILKQVPKK